MYLTDLKDFCLGEVVKIEHVPNPDCKIFHTRGELVSFGNIVMSADSNDKSTPILTQAIYDSLHAIDGIDVVIRPHRVQVVKSPLLSWRTIFPQIKRIFASYMQWEVNLGKGSSKWK